MNHRDCEHESTIENRSRFDFITEREKYLNNLAMLRKTSEEMSVRVGKIKRLYEEVRFRKAELVALRVKLSSVAVKYGLDPISTNGKKD